MTDISHEMGNDLTLSATGDLLVVDGPSLSRQRVLRRLLTNPRALVFHQRYGAGLARFVGAAAPAARIAALVRRQMKLERGVARTPAPIVAVTADQSGTVGAQISFADRKTGEPIRAVAAP